MKKSSFIALILLAALACLGCSRTGVDPVDDSVISFGLNPRSAFSATAVATKATAATGLTSFKCEATQGSAGSETNVSPCWNNVTFTSDGETVPTYSASPKKFWPVSDPSFSFYAVSATGSTAEAVASEAPDLVFGATGTTISMAAGYDKDVICAYSPSGDVTYKTKNSLLFEHIYARLSTVKVTAVAPTAISNITISLVNPRTGGTYNLRTGAGQTDGTGWSNLLPSTDGTHAIYTNAGTITAGANHTGANNDYYVVPGDYYLICSWTASVDDYSQSYEDMMSTTPVSIEGGKVNAIECNLSGDPSDITFSVSVSEWGSNTIAGVEFEHTGPDPNLLLGEFSVSSTKKVKFAKGNLQAGIGTGVSNYIATASEWKLAENQYDFIGRAAGNTSFAAGTTVDLFGWVGESADYDSYGLCTKVSNNDAYYGTGTTEVLKTPWGSIPGFVNVYGEGWYVLTREEWTFLLASGGRTNAVNKRTLATVCSVPGLLILPDEWTLPAGCSFTVTTSNYTTNVYDETAWAKMEAAGAVFLPAAGTRAGTSVSGVGEDGDGYYQSASHYWKNSTSAYNLAFSAGYYGGINPENSSTRNAGFSVRLVKTVN